MKRGGSRENGGRKTKGTPCQAFGQGYLERLFDALYHPSGFKLTKRRAQIPGTCKAWSVIIAEIFIVSVIPPSGLFT
jgi:hypothetical protein